MYFDCMFSSLWKMVVKRCAERGCRDTIGSFELVYLTDEDKGLTLELTTFRVVISKRCLLLVFIMISMCY